MLVPIMYSQKWNCSFQNRIIIFCLPVPTLIYLWEIYIFPGSVCLFCCTANRHTWMWELGLRPCNSKKRNTKMGFSLQCRTEIIQYIHGHHATAPWCDGSQLTRRSPCGLSASCGAPEWSPPAPSGAAPVGKTAPVPPENRSAIQLQDLTKNPL